MFHSLKKSLLGGLLTSTFLWYW